MQFLQSTTHPNLVEYGLRGFLGGKPLPVRPPAPFSRAALRERADLPAAAVLLALLAATTGCVSAPATTGRSSTTASSRKDGGVQSLSSPVGMERMEPGPGGSELCEICLGYRDRKYQAQCDRVSQSVEMCLCDQVVRDAMRGTSIYPQDLTTTVGDCQHSMQEIGLLVPLPV